MIESAQRRIIYDIFLNTELVPKDEGFLPTATLVAEALAEAKQEQPTLQSILITDPVNTFYGTDFCRTLHTIGSSGYDVIITDTDKLPNHNLLYSGIWHIFFGWFSTGKKG